MADNATIAQRLELALGQLGRDGYDEGHSGDFSKVQQRHGCSPTKAFISTIVIAFQSSCFTLQPSPLV